ncbi:hypothetical protein D7Y13_05900 [Corallococcus praedator]|uniref:Lipoprotein n=1 Tax=Corallococcus praedator TaxID=2316724 RepID=A0ABX9QQI4_9BACT|nr:MULTISPECIES: hypothetical protein [Corallococcus]RKH14994.1 hypothetical protein D7X74_19245 [Corallococcus sp. CA047B]RKH33393.1 hypothetical protein D7X75_12200 [Corallococcus sp. CA031C]RKI14517.1 hypothetical protein D7Y13_05900 [Corallococcus praedator]
MRVPNKSLAVACAAVFLSFGCGDDADDGPPQADDIESRRAGESLDSLESRWKRAVKDKPTGIASTVDLSGSSIVLTTRGQTQVDAPGVLVPAPMFPNNQRCLFLTNAQVGAQTGLLVLEGTQIQFTAGTLGSVEVGSATANSVVGLTTRDTTSDSNPTATFPEDWSGTDKSLFFSDAAVIHASNLTLTGFTRGLLITPTGNTPITGSVTVGSAERLYWDAKSVIQVATSTVQSPAFALGGEVNAGALSSPELSASGQPPSMIKGTQAQVTLRPGNVKSQGSFQLTQGVTQQGAMLLPADVELAYDTTPVTVKKNQRALIPVVFREKTLHGDAVLSKLEVTGTGKEAVSVPLDQVESYLDSLWANVGQSGISAPFLAIGLAPLSPFIALGEALGCLFSTCPRAFPIWMETGKVERFHIIVQGKLPPGTYDATVTLVGHNSTAQSIPVAFTITE